MTLKTQVTAVSTPAWRAVTRRAHVDRATFLAQLMAQFRRKIRGMTFGQATLSPRAARRSPA
jgi:hypothetical protein